MCYYATYIGNFLLSLRNNLSHFHSSRKKKVCSVTSIYQSTNAHIISHKTILKHFKTLRHVSILSDHQQGALFLAKIILQYSQFNSYLQMRCCGSISCCVGMCCGAVATQHDMLPQHLVWKYQLNCEYCNITLARNKAPWWWSDKIETCWSVLKCFKSVLCEIVCAFVGWYIEVILLKCTVLQ